jgi:ABC-2 type transport system ATP-binding protein
MDESLEHPILEVKNLVKHFKKVRAVNGVSFKIKRGICFGLLGPNGAGKTTAIEMIEGILPPTSGEIFYQGEPAGRRLKEDAGIQFQSTALMDFLTVNDVLDLFAKLYPRTVDRQKLVDQCKLGDFLNQSTDKLSGGQRQRVLLAVALLSDPRLLFLDEPTTGLDPQARRNFWQLVRAIKAEGKTIVLTTHYMDEAEQLCDELVIIDKGLLIAQGSPQRLLDQHFDYKFVYLNRHSWRDDIVVGCEWEPHGDEIMLKTHSVETTLQQLIQQSVQLDSLRVRTPTLDDLFLKLTGHSLRDGT